MFFRHRSFFLCALFATVLFLFFYLHPTLPHQFGIPGRQQSYNTSSKVSNRRLHFLLPIDAHAAGASSGFCKTTLSALVHGYEPIILNWDVDPEGDVQFAQRMKVFGVYQYLKNLTTHAGFESDLVFMADALDVWFQLSPTTLMARYDELGTAGVVVGAEKTCWPNEWGPACEDVPDSILPKGTYGSDPGPENIGLPHTRPRWANSGVVIGPIPAMQELYKDLVEILHDPKNSQFWGDQAPFNEMLAARRISVDYLSRLFWQTCGTNPTKIAHFINTPYHVDPVIPHERYPPLLYLGPTGEIPAVIHFNDAHEKGLMAKWWSSLWWNKLRGDDQRFRDIVMSRLEDAVLSFAGDVYHQKTWKEICARHLPDL